MKIWWNNIVAVMRRIQIHSLTRRKWIIGILIVATALVVLVIQHFGITLYHPFRLQVSSIALTSDGNILATVGRDEEMIFGGSELRFWDVRSGSQISLLEDVQVVDDIAFSVDGTQVALTHKGYLCPGSGSIQILSFPAGELRSVIYGGANSRATFPCLVLQSPTFSPDGNHIAFVNRIQSPEIQCCGENNVQIWDKERNRLRSEISGEYSSVAYSPDGNTLVLGKDNLVVLWSIEARAVSSQFEGHTSPVNSVAFSPDGTLVASADNDTIRLWNLETGQQAVALQNGASDITFSLDGTQLIYAWGANVGFWNLQEF